jgi:threonyl-tRNA synthetase
MESQTGAEVICPECQIGILSRGYCTFCEAVIEEFNTENYQVRIMRPKRRNAGKNPDWIQASKTMRQAPPFRIGSGQAEDLDT